MSAATIHAEAVAAPDRDRLRALMLGAIGVVYGDIGTSPLYTMKEVFSGHLPLTEHNILGILSLIVWSLVVVVTLKYVVVIMRADNRGQGGVLALSTLAQRDLGKKGAFVVSLLGMLGMALFTGDSLITPAISVLSAVEGLNVAAPSLEPYIVPATLVVIGALFLIQSQGTEAVGKLFGPIMCGWFGLLGLLGLVEIAQHPFILRALLPVYAIGFFYDHGFASFFVLGAVVLSVTGGEALYADMGHFGREAIRRAWLFFVMPCLIVNYFGQGALLVSEPAAVKNPFYLLGPDFMMWPMLILATCATVIASQAVISGAFSLTQQAVQLGYLPRREIRHTSDHEIGQVYIPRNNWLLLTGVVILVLGFRSSSALASAYGISVVGAMTIDAILAFIVVTKLWKWSLAKAVPLFALFLLIDVAFLAANAVKIPDGGWFPLAIAGVVFTMMYVWRKGRRIVVERLYGGDRLTVEEFIAQRCRVFNNRVAGTAVYLTSDPTVAPPTLMHSIKHFKVLHETIVILTVRFCDVPYKTLDKRVEIEDLGEGFHRVVLLYGYMEKPDLMVALPLVERHGLNFDLMKTSFFVGRETLIPGDKSALNRLQEPIFIGMAKTTQSATDFFQLPPNRVVEMGTQVNV